MAVVLYMPDDGENPLKSILLASETEEERYDYEMKKNGALVISTRSRTNSTDNSLASSGSDGGDGGGGGGGGRDNGEDGEDIEGNMDDAITAPSSTTSATSATSATSSATTRANKRLSTTSPQRSRPKSLTPSYRVRQPTQSTAAAPVMPNGMLTSKRKGLRLNRRRSKSKSSSSLVHFGFYV